ncbi:3'-5' exoribonuclease YhaM [compost metagenome]
MAILDLRQLKIGDSVTNKAVYFSSYELAVWQKPKGEKQTYVKGFVTYKGREIAFSIWSATLVEIFKNNDLVGHILNISGEIKEFKKQPQLSITGFGDPEVTHTTDEFIEKLNVDLLFSEFADFIKTNFTESMKKVANIIFFKDKAIIDRFKVEFAGEKMHDAKVGGVLNHSLKGLRLTKTLIENDSRLEQYKCILYLGWLFHDIGKIFEMHDGHYTENSFVSHRITGIELLVQNKIELLTVLSEREYYILISILEGHHGEYESKAKTIWAYIIHLVDMLESQTTGIMDKLHTGNITLKDNGNTTVYVNGENLVV